MKKLSSTLLTLLTAVVFLFSYNEARANRAAAADIAYKWVSDSTYLLTYTLYRDCSGSAEPSTINLCYYNTCNTDKGNVTLSKKSPLSSNGLPVQNACAGTAPTTCSSPAGTTAGFRKWVYEGMVTLPSKCASWRFTVSIAARNTNTNLASTTGNLYSETSLNNIDAPKSSSPTFGTELIQYMCAGVKQSYSYAGVDADGDDISYTLIAPNTAADAQVSCTFPPATTSIGFAGAPYGGTSLATDPFATGVTFSLSPTTGAMVFTPDASVPGTQMATMCMLVTKRRGTKVISTMTRDIQFVISKTCSPAVVNFVINKALSKSILWSAGGGMDTAVVCPNVAHTICFSIESGDPLVTISNVTDNHTTFAPTSSTSTLPSPYPGDGTNKVTNCFNWTPIEKDEGTNYLIIKSQVCKAGNPLLYRLDTIVIEVIRTAYITTADTFICFGEVANLCGHPGYKGALPAGYEYWNITDGIGGKLGTLAITSPGDSCTDVTPSATTTYIFETPQIRSICNRKDNPALTTNQAEVKVVVVNPKIDAGPDTVMCSYNQLQLNANLLNPQPELTYKYKWKPGKFLSDSTIFNPILKFPAGMSVDDIPDFIDFTLTITPYPDSTCVKSDDLHVDILKGFYILTGDQLAGNTGLGYKGRQKGVSDTAICAGQFITLVGWGDPRYNYEWIPAAGVSTPTDFVSGTTTITPGATGTFKLRASRAGCVDSVKSVNIEVQPNPTADIGDDRTICFGDTIQMYAEITPSPDVYLKYTYDWAPGGALERADTFFTYFTGYRTETITFTVKTPAGCTGTDKVTYTVEPRYFMTVSKDTAICPGDTAYLTAAGDALLKTITWKPLTNIDSAHSLTPQVTPVYTTDYVVIGVDSNQCIDSAKVKVTVLPRALIYLEDSITIYPGDVYQINPEGNTLYHTWFPPIGLDDAKIANPKASPLLNTTYTVKAVTESGCSAMDSIYIFVAPDSYIDVPNAFAPGRGENGTFKPVHLGNATLKSFSIYDRWGVKVFESTNMNEGWDGTYGGKPQPLGVYVYVLEAVTAKGRVITKQGNVTLLR